MIASQQLDCWWQGWDLVRASDLWIYRKESWFELEGVRAAARFSRVIALKHLDAGPFADSCVRDGAKPDGSIRAKICRS